MLHLMSVVMFAERGVKLKQTVFLVTVCSIILMYL